MAVDAPKQKREGDLLTADLPVGESFTKILSGRHLRGRVWRGFFYSATLVGLVALVALFVNIASQSFGYIVRNYVVDPELFVEGGDLSVLSNEELVDILLQEEPNRIPVLIRDNLSEVEPAEFTSAPLGMVLEGHSFPDELADVAIGDFEDPATRAEALAPIVAQNLTQAQILNEVQENIIGEQALATWTLFESLLDFERVPPEELAPDGDIRSLSAEELAEIHAQRLPEDTRTIIRSEIAQVSSIVTDSTPLNEVLDDAGAEYPAGIEGKMLSEITPDEEEEILALNMTQERLAELVYVDVVGGVNGIYLGRFPDAELDFISYISLDFLRKPLNTSPAQAGIRTPIIGTLWIMVVTVALAFPIGVGAAIYLEEYASKESMINRLIETNIRNLSGVPSIIYGLLGLAIFVRILSDITQGRTVLSAGATMALLVLPVIIINGQEAIRSVPFAIREGSYGLGATKWQTIWRNVLPAAMPGILTGTILSMSRAIGETAPLLLVGASTFLLADPTWLTSRFTVLPIQIYEWTKNGAPVFRNIAAAAIIVLMIMLLILNASAIFLRQYYRRKLSA